MRQGLPVATAGGQAGADQVSRVHGMHGVRRGVSGGECATDGVAAAEDRDDTGCTLAGTCAETADGCGGACGGVLWIDRCGARYGALADEHFSRDLYAACA